MRGHTLNLPKKISNYSLVYVFYTTDLFQLTHVIPIHKGCFFKFGVEVGVGEWRVD
jgi:hypothetical protein